MQEQIALVMTHVRMVWSHRWIALLVATVVCLAGWGYVISLPSSYTVSAKVYMNTSSVLEPVLRGLALDINTRQQAVDMVRRTLLTRPNLESVARAADLDLRAKTPQQFDGIVRQLSRGIGISGQGHNAFRIWYRHQDPALALRIVEAVLNNFVERSLGETRRDNTKTRQFIEDQIKEYEARLLAAEERVKEFRRRNMERGLLPGQGGDYYSRKQQNLSQLEDAKLRLEEATRRRDALKRQLSGEEPLATDRVRVQGPMSERINALEKRLDDLLLKYTDRHPDVVSTKRLIEELENRNQEYFEALEASGRAAGAAVQEGRGGVYQNLRIALGNAEAEVAALQARVEEFRARDQRLSERIDQILAVEAELKALNRDYDITRANYNKFIERRESLSIANEADRSAELEFNIMEPPRMPRRPSSPNRVAMSAGVFAVGLGAGVAVAWLLAMLRPAFFSRDDLASVTDLPLWGSVSRILTRGERNRRRLGYVMFAGGFATLLAVFAALETMHLMHVDLLSKVQSLVS